jgi:uncharacterized caspase-like protein
LLALPLTASAWILVPASVSAQDRPAARGASVAKADQLLIVDCLLPAQVRVLGNMTYQAPRRGIKATASDCSIRGGEYVAYDRADFGSALKVWLPQAQQGDKVAQTYVGEIYEKGVGASPDFASAAAWYQKAADQGYSRALINLGFLYEKGLGVPKDPARAVALYRQAAGLEGGIVLDAPPGPSQEELNTLRQELERTRQDLDRARRELDQQRLKSSTEIERLTQQKIQAAAAGNTGEVLKLEARLKEREEELERRRQDVTRLQKTTEDLNARLSKSEAEKTALQGELSQARQQLAQSQRELADKRSAMKESERQLESLQQQIAVQRAAGAAAEQAKVKALEADLARRTAELGQQKQQIQKLESEIKGLQDKLRSDESVTPSSSGSQVVARAGPTIQIIDPPVIVTREPASVKVRGGLKARDLVGRVMAPAGLLSFTVNDVHQEVESNGLFRTRIDLTSGKTRVTLLAIDRQGKRGLAEFLLEQEGAEGAVQPKKPLPNIAFGNYHALIIGNQRYQKLPSLDTPENDAKALGELLKGKYGFSVTTILNATRYEILSELNQLRAKLTDKDNLLVYYAGHGQLDRANMRGHWLPVDAEEDSDANWISSVSVTDILNAMTVRHALVIADSCYSGAMTRGAIGQLEAGMSEEARLNWLKAIAKARSRTALTSGGLRPVLDGGGGAHSVFAQNLIDVLSENDDILETQRLYRELSARVLNVALKQRFEQRPEYAPMRFAGHESGDFLFIPRQSGAQASSTSRIR